MTLLPRGVKVHLAFGYIDMRKVSMGSPCWTRACRDRIPSRDTCSCFAAARHSAFHNASVCQSPGSRISLSY
jgi:hypothetical protein